MSAVSASLTVTAENAREVQRWVESAGGRSHAHRSPSGFSVDTPDGIRGVFIGDVVRLHEDGSFSVAAAPVPSPLDSEEGR